MSNKKIKINFYQIGVFFIFFFAVFLRFYRINDRWSVDYDPARDSMVAREALRLKNIPQIGAFSSAGPFVWGPIYFWFIMLSYAIAPNFIFAPWVLYTIVDLIHILVMIKIGKISWGEKGGLILGLITAISTGMLFRASLVNQPTLVPVCGSLVILTFLLYAKTKKPLYLLLMGMSIGWALNNHFQALNYLFFAPLIILLTEKTKIKKVFISSLSFLIGLIIPLLPLAYWDYHMGWKNIKNVLDYFLIGQYRLWVSNRWLIYAGQYWPKLWSSVIGGNLIYGYLFIGLIIVFLITQLIAKKLPKTIFGLATVFGILLVLNRYYRGERFEGYMVYFYPLIIYFSGYVIVSLIKLNKMLAVTFLIPLLFFTLKADLRLIKNQMDPNNPRPIINKLVKELKVLRPKEKFKIYDDRYLSPTPSMMTSFFLSFANLIDEKNGTILGFSTQDNLPYPKLTEVNGILQQTNIYDLTSFWSKKEFDQQRWINVSPKFVCLDILEWWKVKEFKSTFCLTCFTKEKLTAGIKLMQIRKE